MYEHHKPMEEKSFILIRARERNLKIYLPNFIQKNGWERSNFGVLTNSDHGNLPGFFFQPQSQ